MEKTGPASGINLERLLQGRFDMFVINIRRWRLLLIILLILMGIVYLLQAKWF